VSARAALEERLRACAAQAAAAEQDAAVLAQEAALLGDRFEGERAAVMAAQEAVRVSEEARVLAASALQVRSGPCCLLHELAQQPVVCTTV
jgi:hypothetical protein